MAKTARRVAVALLISSSVGLFLLHGWQNAPSALFLRTSILGLSATITRAKKAAGSTSMSPGMVNAAWCA